MQTQSIEFKFRKPRQSAIDTAIAEGLAVPVQRNPVTLPVPQYSATEIAERLASGGDVADWILNVINSRIVEGVRDWLMDESINPTHAQIEANNFNPTDFTIDELAKEEPQGASEKIEITKEMFAIFEAVFTTAFMENPKYASIGGERKMAVSKGICGVLKKKFTNIADENQLNTVRNGLAAFAEFWLPANTENENYQTVVDVLTDANARIKRVQRKLEVQKTALNFDF